MKSARRSKTCLSRGYGFRAPRSARPRNDKNPRVSGGFDSSRLARSLLLPQSAELLLEAREAAAAIEQMLLAAGPGRVRLRVDIELQLVARLAPRGAGGEFGAVGHDDLDGVIVRMDVGLH